MSGGRRQTDIFQLNGGDVFSYLAANQRCLKISNVFYGIDGTCRGPNKVRDELCTLGDCDCWYGARHCAWMKQARVWADKRSRERTDQQLG